MRLFDTCSCEDRATRRESAPLPRCRDAWARRLVAKALAVLAACAPCMVAAHTAGATAAVDVVECAAHARMHHATAPQGGATVADGRRDGRAEGARPEYRPASTQSLPESPAGECETESDARPRMNPGRSAQPPGDLTMPVTWRQRYAPDDGAPSIGASMACPKGLAARHASRFPVARAAATPFSRFDRAARGPPAFAVASHR